MHLTFKIGSIEESNRWFQDCKRREEPCVVVSRRRKYARVEWDCISIPSRLDDRVSANTERIVKQIRGVFDKVSNPASRFQYSAYVRSLDNLHLQDAEEVTEHVFKILNSCLYAS